MFSILKKDPRILSKIRLNKSTVSYMKALCKARTIPVTFRVAKIFKTSTRHAIRWSISAISWKMSIPILNFIMCDKEYHISFVFSSLFLTSYSFKLIPISISAIVLLCMYLSVVKGPIFPFLLNFRDLLSLEFCLWALLDSYVSEFILVLFLGVLKDINLFGLNECLSVRVANPEDLAVLKSRIGTSLLGYF